MLPKVARRPGSTSGPFPRQLSVTEWLTTKVSLARKPRPSSLSEIYAVMAETLSRPVEHVVVVTHGFTLTYIITAWLEVPWESAGYASFASKPGSITTLVEDDFFRNRQVATLADTTHLNHMT